MSKAMNQAERADSPLVILLRGSMIEAMRRRGFVVLLIFMALYLGGIAVAAVVGVENPATATFLLNLGLEMAFLLALLATILTAARQIPDDMELRTVHPLLAKPLGRGQYVTGRILGAWLGGTLAFIPLFLLGWAPPVFLLPSAMAESNSSALLMQSFVLQITALGVAAAVTTMLSLIMPRGMAVIVALALMLQGHSLTGIVASRTPGETAAAVARWTTNYLPNLDLLRLTTAYTDGAPVLSAMSVLARLGYGAIFAAAATMLAIALFRRRPL